MSRRTALAMTVVPARGRHAARVVVARGTDALPMARCTKDGRPWHPLGADGRAVCPICWPEGYSRRHAKHRAAVAR